MGLNDKNSKSSKTELKIKFNLNQFGSPLPDNIDEIPFESAESLGQANKIHRMVEYFHKIASDHFVLDGYVTDNVEITQVTTTVNTFP